MQILRTTRGWTQSDLARASGVKRASISEYEADITTPDATTVERLLAAMELRWSALDLGRWFLERLAAESSSGERSGSIQPTAREAAAEVSDLAAKLSRLAAALLEGGGEENQEPGIQPAIPEEARKAARDLWQEVKPLPSGSQLEILRQAPPETLWAVCELLCQESQRLCADRPDRASALAELAATLADGAGDEGPLRSKLRGFAWAHVGNALRAKGDLFGAERVFASAERAWQSGEEEPSGFLEEGMVFALKASLRRAQRRFEEAGQLLERAAASSTSRKFAAQVMVSRAKLFEERGMLEEAVELLEGVDETSGEEDGRLLLCVKHNLADNLSKLGRYREAEALLPEARALSSRAGGELDRVRLMWTEGRVAAGLGAVGEGIAALGRVRGEFASRGMAYDTALVSLELAACYAEQGRTAEIKSLARHMVPIFQSQEIHREALAALALFRRAAEKDKATAGFLRQLVAYLRKARHDPGLRFQG